MTATTTLTPHRGDPARSPGPHRGVRSCLGPEEAIPDELGELSMAELQVLHSRICRQLDREYLTTPHGPHPCTTDRLHDVLGELDARDNADLATSFGQYVIIEDEQRTAADGAGSAPMSGNVRTTAHDALDQITDLG